MLKTSQKYFFVFEIIPSELVAIKCLAFSSAVNVLTISLKTLHITKRDFFQHNYLQIDH